MTETRIVCDRCREPITTDRTLFIAQCGPFLPARATVDLCADCAGDLARWLATDRPMPTSEARTP